MMSIVVIPTYRQPCVTNVCHIDMDINGSDPRDNLVTWMDPPVGLADIGCCDVQMSSPNPLQVMGAIGQDMLAPPSITLPVMVPTNIMWSIIQPTTKLECIYPDLSRGMGKDEVLSYELEPKGEEDQEEQQHLPPTPSCARPNGSSCPDLSREMG